MTYINTFKVTAAFGIYMILMGVIAFLLIGGSAKTALISGGSMGALALFFSYNIAKERFWAYLAAMAQTVFLIGVFAWRSTLAFLGTLEAIAIQEPFTGKAAAFLTIGSMFVFALITFSILISSYKKSVN
jgi:hypothetical protein